MQYTNEYDSPIGKIVMAADELGLSGLWFEGQRYFGLYLQAEHEKKELPIFEETKCWLDTYFNGKMPTFTPPLHILGTPFQQEICELMCHIPYGETTTYGALAKELAKRRGIAQMSAQAVGGAVGRNEISIIVPCHRVLGVGGKLMGYAGGLDKKRFLLQLECAILNP